MKEFMQSVQKMVEQEGDLPSEVPSREGDLPPEEPQEDIIRNCAVEDLAGYAHAEGIGTTPFYLYFSSDGYAVYYKHSPFTEEEISDIVNSEEEERQY